MPQNLHRSILFTFLKPDTPAFLTYTVRLGCSAKADIHLCEDTYPGKDEVCIQAVLSCHRRSRRSGRETLRDHMKFLLMAVFEALLSPIAVP